MLMLIVVCSTQQQNRALVDPFSDGLVWWISLGIYYGCYYTNLVLEHE